MAEGGRRRRRSREDDGGGPSFGTLLATGAIAAGVGAVFYGAKKLFEYVNEERALAEKESGCYRPPPDERPGGNFSAATADEVRRRTATGGVPKVVAEKPAGKKLSLADTLEEYYREYVSVKDAVMQRTLRNVDEVKYVLLKHIQKEYGWLGVMSFENHGSAFEDLMVVSPEYVDLLMTARLDTTMWALVMPSDVDIETPGYFGVKRMNLEEHPLGSHPYDDYLDNMFLSRELLASAYREAITDATSYIDRCSLTTEVDPTTITMTVNDPGALGPNLPLCINLFPAICLNGKLVTSRSHPSLNSAAEHQALWQQSFASLESKRLRAMDPERRCCHLKCLKIMKAVRLNHPAQFGALPSYVYKTVLLHMMADTPEEDFWAPECLQEQFVDMLNQLIYYLQGRRLPCVGDARVNLLEGVPGEVCDGIVRFITSRIGKEKLHTLLDKRAGAESV